MLDNIENVKDTSVFVFCPTQKEKKDGKNPVGYIKKDSSFNLKNVKTGLFISCNIKKLLKEENLLEIEMKTQSNFN